jgi:hypothetical protein
MATRTYDASRASTTVEAGEGARGAGWVTFAAIMLGLAGIWNVIDGLLALGSSKVYGVNTVYVFSDLRTWGWIVLILGALQLVAAGTVFTGNEFARWFGILAAGVNALGQLAFVPVYPFWALMLFAADVVVIYGLAVYGGKKLRTA